MNDKIVRSIAEHSTEQGDEQTLNKNNQETFDDMQPKFKISKSTLAILASVVSILLAQAYALGCFDTTQQVTQKSLDQKFTYKGGLRNGNFSGKATITDNSGNVVKTKFEKGKIIRAVEYTKKDAYTILQNKDEEVIIQLAEQVEVKHIDDYFIVSSPNFSYEGDWRYAGTWQGKMTFANGAVYDGSWKNGLPDGKGTYLPIVGSPLAGSFKFGVLENED